MNEGLIIGLIFLGSVYVFQLVTVLLALFEDEFYRKRDFFWCCVPFLPFLWTIVNRIWNI